MYKIEGKLVDNKSSFKFYFDSIENNVNTREP